jgi:small-conductance mechanosensitive channel
VIEFLKVFVQEHFYACFVTLVLFAAYLYIQFKIRAQKKIRLKKLKNREIQDPVETDSPVTNQIKNLKDIGRQSLESRFSFMQKVLPVLIILLWFVVFNIPHLGKLPGAYISIIAAVVSVIAGFSLRPFLENLFSGIVISFFRSVRVGDTVMIDNHYGLIEEIGLTHSTLKMWDWNRLVIPNATLIQKEIQNLTKSDSFIWAHVEFLVAYDTDLDAVEKVAIEGAKNSSFYKNKTEEPSFWVMDMGERSVKCWVAAWADTPGEAWELRTDMRKHLIKKFKELGVKTHSYELSSPESLKAVTSS